MKLNFKSLGKGQPIILLHGLLGMLDNWLTLAHKFAISHQVYLIDLRNHGKSPHSPIHNYPALCNDLLELIHEYKIENPWIIGHSMGGKLAMYLALNHPKIIKGVIVMDIAPRAYSSNQNNLLDYSKIINPSLLKSREEASLLLTEKNTPNPIKQLLLKNLKSDKKQEFHWKFNQEALANQIDNITTSISSPTPYYGPTLFIKGELSDYIQIQDQKTISALFPNYKMTTIPQAGHWVQTDNPESTYNNIIEFISKKKG